MNYALFLNLINLMILSISAINGSCPKNISNSGIHYFNITLPEELEININIEPEYNNFLNQIRFTTIFDLYIYDQNVTKIFETEGARIHIRKKDLKEICGGPIKDTNEDFCDYNKISGYKYNQLRDCDILNCSERKD